ncbi:hypothetical protein ACTA71_001175 [Dictyostelium dimigraforme]
MNDEEFFSLLNQYPMRGDNPSTTATSQPTNLFSIFNNMMGGMNRNQNENQNQEENKEKEFWIKLKLFLDSNVNNQEEADLIFNNFKKNHLEYKKKNNLK